MNICKIIVVLSITVFGSLTVQAHHAANATFDTSQTVEIEGFVKEFNFNNPHVSIVLAVMDENGVESDWVASGPAVAGWRRYAGWSQDTIEEGQFVRLVGRPARHDGPMILMERAEIEGGMLLEINPDDGSLVRVLEGQVPDQTPDLAIPDQQLPNGQPNLSGTWLAIAPGAASNVRNQPEYTAAGRQLQDAWDPTKDPAYLTCEPRGLQRVVGTNQTMRFTQTDNYVLIEQEDNNTPRLIYLDGRGPATTEHTLRGHSAAHYEGDTLVIETTQLLSGASSGRGTILSDQTTITERYSRADDEQYAALTAEITFTDPVNLAAPLIGGWRKLQTQDYEFAETECVPPVLTGAN